MSFFTSDLASSKNDQHFTNLKDLIFRINKHVVQQEYAVVFNCTKNSKLEEKKNLTDMRSRKKIQRFSESASQKYQ